jgi:hypothetical protein
MRRPLLADLIEEVKRLNATCGRIEHLLRDEARWRNSQPKPAPRSPREKRAYPIEDKSHARNALARASGKPEEARVRAAVKRKYPDIGRKTGKRGK